MVKQIIKKVKKNKTIDDMKRDYVITTDGNSVVVKYSNIILTKLELEKGEGESDVRNYLESNPSIFQTGWNRYTQSKLKRRETLGKNSEHRKELKSMVKDKILSDIYESKLKTTLGKSKKRSKKN